MRASQSKKLVQVVSSCGLAVWVVIIILQTAAFLLHWWPQRAHGFALSSPRFWSQQVLPWFVAAACLTSLVLLALRRTKAFVGLMYVFPAAYLSGAVTARIIFPISSTSDLQYSLYWPCVFRWGFWIPLLVCGVLLLCLAVLTGLRRRRYWALIVPASLFGLFLGSFFIWSQRADAPSTRPYSERFVRAMASERADDSHEVAIFGVKLKPVGNAIEFDVAHLTVLVRPMMTFFSPSPDRCWTCFAPWDYGIENSREHDFTAHDVDGAYMAYEGERPAWLRVGLRQDGDSPLHIEAHTFLPEPVYSHLNEFCRVTIRGHKRLSLVFSPMPGSPVELQESPHPDAWNNIREFGYLDADGIFHWAKGAQKEYGPYTEIASGALGRDEPLTMTVLDDGIPMCRVILHDWTSQLSVAASPTAGWGVPANSIYPRVGPRQDGSPVRILFHLAATHVGRGYDSVGHAAGVYRNRITIEPIPTGSSN